MLDLGEKLFEEATMPCCRQNYTSVAYRGRTGIRSKFDKLWVKFVNGERSGLREFVKETDAEGERLDYERFAHEDSHAE